MFAVGCAHPVAAWRPSPDGVPAHQPFDPLVADGLALGPQLSMNARRAISFPVASMNPPDIAQELTIGDLARALRP
jgi:hypothetical protein